VLTGLWPHTNGCTDNNIPLAPQYPTLPEMLADQSYRTGYFGKWHLGDELFAQRGFQEWVSIEDGYDAHFSSDRPTDEKSDYHHFLIRLGYKPDLADGSFSRDFAVRLPIEHCKAAFLAGEASDFILRSRKEPWMLYVGFLEPHRPYEGPLNDLHSAEEAPVPANYPGIPVEKEPRYYESLRRVNQEKGYDLGDRSVVQRLNRNYAGLCSQVDHALGRILWSLETSGQADNTIIVLTSDHGELMGSHSLLAKMAMYEESVRVPFLLRAPFRQNSQLRVEQPVSNISIVPTLLELLGHDPGDRLQGQSLLPVLTGARPKPDDAFVEWTGPQSDPCARAVVTVDGWKLALYDKDTCLLFDRNKDPLELENLYYRRDSRDVIRRLCGKIEDWQKRTGDHCDLATQA
jgi:arylsulfatase A-like enzyme